uniref:Glutathione transferase n=1 Tax=Compsopogon caeruleus TaxID=31354 RepID=A0A7S1XG90_9RHOD|mmetsp:Transcript_5149/g.10478  ORF Transcript_5149/g.10478 Transcript_5149/m.10478 type:complete len:218 (+) Transcript_5149:73-726(+)
MREGHVKVTYFGFPGRAEPIRLALVIGGVEFEDERVAFSDWPVMKGKVPFGTLPVVEFDGAVIGQSIAALMFVGKKTGLYPDDPISAARVDEILLYLHDFSSETVSTVWERDSQLREKRVTKLMRQSLPEVLGRVEQILAQNGSGFCVGDAMTVADLFVFSICLQLTVYQHENSLPSGTQDLWPGLPHLLALRRRINGHPAVRDWYLRQPSNLRALL